MSLLNGFEPFDFDVGVASVSITPNGLTFNRSVAIKLGLPSYALLLINKEKKQIAIKACEEDTPKAMSFYKETAEDAPIRSVRWNSRDLLNCLSEMMDWDLKKMSHRVEGKLLQEERAMLFDLSMATDMK